MLRRLYDWTMGKAAGPFAEYWLALFAFVEASFFPIPPHPVLGLMCLARPDRAIRYAIITTLASVAGGLLGYAIGHFAFAMVGEKLLDALHLTASFPYAACKLRGEAGFIAIIAKGATPIPFKLITITAGFIGMPIAKFLLASVISRSISFMIVGVLFRLFGAPIKAWIDKYLAVAVAGFIVLVVAGFVAAAMLGGHKSAVADECTGVTMETLTQVK
ncbi:membrane protein YqaA with SNARE-associated domain [Novosphingobium sp. SG751A]|uniref:YqaA family protein n=1 Tax=Novosphingobium sp. SG751A TaxID=2587000 RepID=UPI0015537723|nr:YqaA family protein [Novosphingobium sp. SG751A]NOW44894.1 membrane protein YqaA with SNARE-associated domain [Novosphingobium sp. SG751A]